MCYISPTKIFRSNERDYRLAMFLPIFVPAGDDYRQRLQTNLSSLSLTLMQVLGAKRAALPQLEPRNYFIMNETNNSARITLNLGNDSKTGKPENQQGV